MLSKLFRLLISKLGTVKFQTGDAERVTRFTAGLLKGAKLSYRLIAAASILALILLGILFGNYAGGLPPSLGCLIGGTCDLSTDLELSLKRAGNPSMNFQPGLSDWNSGSPLTGSDLGNLIQILSLVEENYPHGYAQCQRLLKVQGLFAQNLFPTNGSNKGSGVGLGIGLNLPF